LAALHSWQSLLRTSRAAAAVVIIGGIGLLLPPQTHDMLAALGDSGFWPPAAFHIALLLLSFSAWFWSRAVISARFCIADNQSARAKVRNRNVDVTAFDWLPRILFLIGAAIGLILLVRNWDWINLAVAVIWISLSIFLLRNRVPWHFTGAPLGHNFPRSRRGVRGVRDWLLELRHRIVDLIAYAPFGWIAGIIMLATGFALFVMGALDTFFHVTGGTPGFALWVAAAFPGPAIVLLGLGLMIGPLTALTFIADRYRISLFGGRINLKRPPVVLVLLVYAFVAVPALFHVHVVRITANGVPPDSRQPLKTLFDNWVQACAPSQDPNRPLHPIIVAVSGGATRAALWAAATLYRIEDLSGAGRPSIFAISSVSGGSLGVAAYLTLVAKKLVEEKKDEKKDVDEKAFCASPAIDKSAPYAGRASKLGLNALVPTLLLPGNQPGVVPLAGDALGPVLGGWLFGDFPRALLEPVAALMRWPFHVQPRGGDSAEALERAFEQLWRPHRSPEESSLPDDSSPFAASYLSLYDAIPTGAYTPIWIVNGTDVTTGNRLLTVPFSAKRNWPFDHAYDVLGLLKADVRISTAINNSARFPYLEPFGEVRPDGPSDGKQHELVDGGYFDNEGMLTALELAGALGKETGGPKVEPIIIQITADADPTATIHNVMRCPFDGDDHPGDESPLAPGGNRMSLQVIAPLLGLYDVRTGHSAATLQRARDTYCGGANGKQRFFHFYLSAKDGEIPLNWILSSDTAVRIWRAVDDHFVGNDQEYARLKKLMTDPAY
jgi:hypothetical protein